MAESSSKPNVLIFGGLNTYSRAIAGYLVPVEGESLVSHVRIVDKYSVKPPTTYLGAEFSKLLEKPEIEYKQANLTVPAIVHSMFDPPEGQPPYDYVFDLTGEVRPDRTDMIQINTTCNVARSIGEEAAKRQVKAYVRLMLPFYETSSKGSGSEKEDVEPHGTIGTWWHETLRILGAIENLNLVILRTGLAYGPYIDYGDTTSCITVAAVYGYLKSTMKSVWSPGKNPTNTVHSDDIAGAVWACAQWIASKGRKEADALAGEEIIFHNDKSKVKDVQGAPAPDKKVIAPLFNLVDDSKSTLLSVGQTVTSFFGTTFDFFNLPERTWYKVMDDDKAVEDINEHHVGGWTTMIQNSNPPIQNTPLSAYMDKYALEKRTIAFDNAKIKEVVGYSLKRPAFDHEAIREIVDKWKAEGSWPIV
ncbi:nad dependent epimerase dehydratase family protein [Moniliophthora roreri MCA 2997]|uniref:Nad dependent epimerase dehydratase family protein n=1 Tax=Moniliophthora roreri (strain MCA 2997) TaxID=1381753 RepID=V2WZK4_MONRO|nr:nad dependent epimerase dehydratase family protein [Moniliophthora roreri MCA 2997]